MIITGVDVEGARIFTTDPSGAYRGFKATAVGRRNDEANKLLEEKYVDGSTIEDSIKLAISAIKAASDSQITSQTVKVAVIRTETEKFKRLSEQEVSEYFG